MRALRAGALHPTARHGSHAINAAGLLPALEKHGKTCQVLLGPEEVCLVQTTGDADGMQIFISLGLVRGVQALQLGFPSAHKVTHKCTHAAGGPL